VEYEDMLIAEKENEWARRGHALWVQWSCVMWLGLKKITKFSGTHHILTPLIISLLLSELLKIRRGPQRSLVFSISITPTLSFEELINACFESKVYVAK
jgi:hypothetical protein